MACATNSTPRFAGRTSATAHAAASTRARPRLRRAAFRSRDFVLLQGRELLVSYTEPGHMAKVFCGRCGSSLFGGTWPDGPEVSIRLGTLDDDPGIRPSYHSFAEEVPAWDKLADDGLSRYPRRPPHDMA